MEHIFQELLVSHGYRFVSGVPDSGLKAWLALLEHQSDMLHISATNEGAALALAMGHSLASGRPGVVYLQNSGLGNVVNPLASLLSNDAFSIPALLVMGWRGMPNNTGTSDEPQHRLMGRAQLGLLAALDVPFVTLSSDRSALCEALKAAQIHFEAFKSPFALLVPPGLLDGKRVVEKLPRLPNLPLSAAQLTKLEPVKVMALVRAGMPTNTRFVGTTGYTARDLNALASEDMSCQPGGRDFFCVGGMGHAVSLALGISLTKPLVPVCLFDGDGAALMHLGSMAMVAARKPEKFFHILLNNACHESTGAQALAHGSLDFANLAQSLGYASVSRASSIQELESWMTASKHTPGPHFLEVLTSQRGQKGPAGRPTGTLQGYRNAFLSEWEKEGP